MSLPEVSRENHAKFLLNVTLQGHSLIQATWDCMLSLCDPDRHGLAVIAGSAHVKSIHEQCPHLLLCNLFCEPDPKDLVAAIGLTVAILAQHNPDAIIGSFAADHMISSTDAFLSAISEAVQVTHKGYLVTTGIAPSHPSTGFGYVQLGDKLSIVEAPNVCLVSSFKEKPDACTTAAYITTGSYHWNASMFINKASFLLELLREYKPKLEEALMRVAAMWDDEASCNTILEEVWPGLEKIAIDHAVAEPAALEGHIAVVLSTFSMSVLLTATQS